MATPEAILNAAARLLAREGVDALTMPRLARATGLSRASLYRNVGDREALLDELAARGLDVGERGETRLRILTAAREVFSRGGFEAATMEQVAEQAKVGVATVYRHFGDKDGLIAGFLDGLGPRRAAREARQKATGELRSDLVRLVQRLLEGMRDDAAIVRLVLIEGLRGGELLPRVRALSTTRIAPAIAAILRDARGLRDDVDAMTLARSLGGMVFAFGVIGPLLREEPMGDPAATARAIVTTFLDGALAPKKEKP